MRWTVWTRAVTDRGSWRCTLRPSAHRPNLSSSLIWETRYIVQSTVVTVMMKMYLVIVHLYYGFIITLVDLLYCSGSEICNPRKKLQNENLTYIIKMFCFQDTEQHGSEFGVALKYWGLIFSGLSAVFYCVWAAGSGFMGHWIWQIMC